MIGRAELGAVPWHLVCVAVSRDGDYVFYNPYNERALTSSKAWHLVRAPRARLPSDHPFGWYFEALALLQRELVGETGPGSGMHDHVMGWDE